MASETHQCVPAWANRDHAPDQRTKATASQRAPRPAVFLDRDGVIIENRDDYVKSWREVRFLPGAFAAIRQLPALGYVVVIVTNQSAIGRGLLTLADAVQINRQIVAEIEAHGGRVDACYLCPHHPAAHCDCRKPAPGMLLRARDDLQLDLTRSHLVGDALTDIEAAEAAQVPGVLVRTGRGAAEAMRLGDGAPSRCRVVPDLGAALDHIRLVSEKVAR